MKSWGINMKYSRGAGIQKYRDGKARGINKQSLVKNTKDNKNDIFRNVQNTKNEAGIGPLPGGI